MAGWDYVLVHLKYTIPPAILLTALFRPFQTRLDVYKVAFLVIVAVFSTIPWDSYLLHKKIWSYPATSTVGPTLYMIPIEELFFFVIQTYNTSIFYLLLAKPVLGAACLPVPPRLVKGRKQRRNSVTNLDIPLRPIGTAEYESREFAGAIGTMILVVLIGWGGHLVFQGGRGTYMGLILVWAGPIILLLWSLSFQYIVAVPLTLSIIPIFVPTLYLWFVDRNALSNGTWIIEPGTKFDLQLFGTLDIEEALFFLMTNILVVFGQLAFDHALSILYAFPSQFPEPISQTPSPGLLIRGLLLPSNKYENNVAGIRDALHKLQAKSRSFSLASGVFQGRLRINLVLLYSFCRIADDLVDESATFDVVDSLKEALEHAYFKTNHIPAPQPKSNEHHDQNGNAGGDSMAPSNGSFRVQAFSALPSEITDSIQLLPLNRLPFQPLQDLLDGFRIDMQFPNLQSHTSKDWKGAFPIKTEADLEHYAYCVAGTVASLILHLAIGDKVGHDDTLAAGIEMGKALQYINIARDIGKDAAIGRCYLPASWLAEQDLSPLDVVRDPSHKALPMLRNRLLVQAMVIYNANIAAIDTLPETDGCRRGIRAAVENYMEIGRVLREKPEIQLSLPISASSHEEATVGSLRRIRVFVNALSQG